ncbi:MAG TPA: glycogen phosphorylase, partial [Lachnospiraceae bacterium]|nr:glycogen phosphorylase [Lachnospiraceae bacterium]
MITTSSSFDKESFKKDVKEQVKVLYRKTLQEATPQQIYQAVCYAVKDTIIDNWMKTQKAMEVQDPKTVYYMSMEFLMGRALGNNLINLCEYQGVKKALKELDVDLN